ncbi:MAG UNVERIFIED_CONTAM: thermonuclease family protein [Microcystis novacekii LVE1205-3]
MKDGMVWVYDRFKGNCPRWNEIERAFQETRSNRKGIFGEIRCHPGNGDDGIGSF